MSIKLIAVDIDGTLLNSQRQVTPEVFQAIQDAKAAGVKVVIATGRPIPGVLPLLEELNLNQDGDYVITFNGGLHFPTLHRPGIPLHHAFERCDGLR